MLPDRVSNPGPLTYESGALRSSPCGPAKKKKTCKVYVASNDDHTGKAIRKSASCRRDNIMALLPWKCILTP